MNRAPEFQNTKPLWQDGWYQFSGQLASPNFGPRPPGTSINLLVIHTIMKHYA